MQYIVYLYTLGRLKDILHAQSMVDNIMYMYIIYTLQEDSCKCYLVEEEYSAVQLGTGRGKVLSYVALCRK